ncbi:MAG: hypothetical protein IJ055_10545 [Oscillospiraceae bacterium]|nr:hypothetical protein [Oscillospiraceae bacterium]
MPFQKISKREMFRIPHKQQFPEAAAIRQHSGDQNEHSIISVHRMLMPGDTQIQAESDHQHTGQDTEKYFYSKKPFLPSLRFSPLLSQTLSSRCFLGREPLSAAMPMLAPHEIPSRYVFLYHTTLQRSCQCVRGSKRG